MSGLSILSFNSSPQISYPSNLNNRSTYFTTLFDRTILPYNKQYNNCNNTLCYTYSKNYIYKPHSAYGMVGTTAAGYLGQRKRL
jgi:hypothetical protein